MAGEAYAKRYPGGFVDDVSAFDAVAANNIETALLRLLGEDPAANEVGIWTPASGRLVFDLIRNAQIAGDAAIAKSKLAALNIGNADIAAAAAIAYSKLNLANSVVNSDIAAAAAIVLSKLNGYPADVAKVPLGDGTWAAIKNAQVDAAAAIEGSKLNVHIGSTPPGTPATGDIWIYNGLTGLRWYFVYDNAEATYKWVYVGGAPVLLDFSASVTPGATYVDLAGMAATAPRAGEYLAVYGGTLVPGGGNTAHVSLKKGAAATADADSINGAAVANNSGGSRGPVVTAAASDVFKLQVKVSAGAVFVSTSYMFEPRRVI